jgi:pyruvate/2-oxoglutarate dehydrogenase complex dihydrolipoamide acyltransferase (E2) component
MLGIPQEVVAPADGVVGASLVEPGDAVEYGQPLIVIEFASASASGASAPGASAPGTTPGTTPETSPGTPPARDA